MGHRTFQKKSAKEGSSASTSDLSVKSEESPEDTATGEMNGLRSISREQVEAVEESRRRVRDRVSTKMGELLLRGYTMLNAYCERCMGILMEDRQGERLCITCEMLRADVSPPPTRASRIVAEIPLDASDDISDSLLASAVGTNSGTTSARRVTVRGIDRKTEVRKNVDEKEPEPLNEDSLHKVFPVGATPKLKRSYPSTSRNPAVQSALSAVEEKLRWCGERLRRCDDLTEILLLQKAIRGGIDIIEAYGAS